MAEKCFLEPTLSSWTKPLLEVYWGTHIFLPNIITYLFPRFRTKKEKEKNNIPKGKINILCFSIQNYVV